MPITTSGNHPYARGVLLKFGDAVIGKRIESNTGILIGFDDENDADYWARRTALEGIVVAKLAHLLNL